MPDTTPVLGLSKPIVGADDDVWGGMWNTNADILDAQVMTPGAADLRYLRLTGGTLTGPLTVSRYEIIDGGAAGPAQLFLDTPIGNEHMIVARSGGNARWAIRPGGPSVESGGNTGANFIITRHDDAGVAVDNPLTITRSTGVVDFSAPPTAPTVAPGTNTTQLATTAFVSAAVAGSTAGVASFNTRTGAVTLSSTDVSGASGLLTTGGAMTGGLNFGSAVGTAVGDTSKHVSLYGGSGTSGTFGFNVTSGRINYSVPIVSHVHSFNVAGVEEVRIGNTGISLLNTGWISGLLAPTAGDHAATKAYVDSQVGSASSLTISDTAPASPNPNAMWWDSIGLQLYIWYNDGNSSQWVVSNNTQGALAEAPKDGGLYARSNGAWTASGANTNVGRNVIHNPLFNVAQRGAGPWTAGYTADRWTLAVTNDVVSFALNPMADADKAQIGDEAAINSFQNSFTGNAAAGSVNMVQQRTEDVRRLAGKTVTVSFWAKATGALKFGVCLEQGFGSGGSPSAFVPGIGQSVTLSTTWTRYALTFSVPSIAGKVVGTDSNSLTYLNFWYSAGSSFSVRSGNMPVQSGTIQLWGVQLELGSAATPLEKPDPQQDLAKCQRFYQVGQVVAGGYSAATINAQATVSLPVTMRALPTVAVPSNVDLALTSPTQSPLNGNNALLFGGVTPSGASGWGINRTFTASADL